MQINDLQQVDSDVGMCVARELQSGFTQRPTQDQSRPHECIGSHDWKPKDKDNSGDVTKHLILAAVRPICDWKRNAVSVAVSCDSLCSKLVRRCRPIKCVAASEMATDAPRCKSVVCP